MAFKEPFNPLTHEDPTHDPKSTNAEFVALSDELWKRRVEISPIGELGARLSSRERDWIEALSEQSRFVLLDSTRTWSRTSDLVREFGARAVFVHLHRPTPQWVTSQLLPSAGTKKRALLNVYRGKRFFRTTRIPGNYAYDLIAHELRSQGEIGGVAREPAYALLAELHEYINAKIERSLKDSGARWISVPMVDFAREPSRHLSQLFSLAGWGIPIRDEHFSHIRGPGPAYQPNEAAWRGVRSWAPGS